MNLDKCPFCAFKKPSKFACGGKQHWIACPKCGAEGPTKETSLEAHIAWNTRTNQFDEYGFEINDKIKGTIHAQ